MSDPAVNAGDHALISNQAPINAGTSSDSHQITSVETSVTAGKNGTFFHGTHFRGIHCHLLLQRKCMGPSSRGKRTIPQQKPQLLLKTLIKSLLDERCNRAPVPADLGIMKKAIDDATVGNGRTKSTSILKSQIGKAVQSIFKNELQAIFSAPIQLLNSHTQVIDQAHVELVQS